MSLDTERRPGRHTLAAHHTLKRSASLLGYRDSAAAPARIRHDAQCIERASFRRVSAPAHTAWIVLLGMGGMPAVGGSGHWANYGPYGPRLRRHRGPVFPYAASSPERTTFPNRSKSADVRSSSRLNWLA